MKIGRVVVADRDYGSAMAAALHRPTVRALYTLDHAVVLRPGVIAEVPDYGHYVSLAALDPAQTLCEVGFVPARGHDAQ